MFANVPLDSVAAAHPYPLLFATISGAHLYGFPSPDSDFDLRGAHILPLESVVGLKLKDETVANSRIIDGWEMGSTSIACCLPAFTSCERAKWRQISSL